jgi:hypothetical protein
MSSTIEDQFKALQGEVDVLAEATLDTPLASLAQWDSLAILLVISYFENIQKVTLSGAQIRACNSAREIFNLKPLSK